MISGLEFGVLRSSIPFAREKKDGDREFKVQK